jgi:hypothetical protein
MMTSLFNLHAAHLKAASVEWDKAVTAALRYIHYPDREGQDNDPIRKLAVRLLTISETTRFSVFGGPSDGINEVVSFQGYSSPQSVCSLLEWMAHFIGYRILDDGDPSVDYLRYDMMDGHVVCDSGHEDARPYFHQNRDLLRARRPNAPALTVELALQILNNYEADREKTVTEMLADIAEHGAGCIWDAEDVEAYRQSPFQNTMMAVAIELQELT